MSFEHAAIAMNHTRSTGAVRAVMIGIASMANDEGQSFPGLLKLAQYAGYEGYDADPAVLLADAPDGTEEERWKWARRRARELQKQARRSAIKAVQQLEALGEVAVVTNGGGTLARPDHMRPNLYTVTLSCPPNCDHSAQHRILTREEIDKRILGSIRPATPVDNPQGQGVAAGPGGGPQARGEVAPGPAESSVNPPLTNSETQAEAGTTREDTPNPESDAQTTPEPARRPHGSIAAAQKLMNEAARPKRKRRRAYEAPPPPPKLTPEHEALRAAALTLMCPARTGQRHMIPRTTTICLYCQHDAATPKGTP